MLKNNIVSGFLKKYYKGLLVFGVVETFTFYKFRPTDLETFFFIWGFIALAFLIYNAFNLSADERNLSFGLGYQNQNAHFLLGEVERKYETDTGKERSGGGFLDSLNFLYIFFLCINVVGYIVFMPE